MKYDREKIRKAVAEYVYFLNDSHPKGPDDVTVWDSKRRKLHNAIFESAGLDPAKFEDKQIADKLDSWDKYFDTIEQYIDYHTSRLFDTFNNEKAEWGNGIKTYYALKDRIDRVLKYWKDKLDARITVADNTMRRALNGLRAWNDDRPDGVEYVGPWAVGINSHDFNGEWGYIKRLWASMEEFAKQPREAFLQDTVKVQFDDKLDKIKKSIERLESFAFRAMQTKYYTYPIKEKTENAK